MKKLYSLLVIVFFGFIGNAQIVTIPDANFKAKLIALGVDTNGDGNIQQSEALAKTFLAIDHASITDLTGISAFSNLTTLNIGFNSISSLTPLNGLTSLSNLYANGNQITDLSVMDSMPSLQYFSISNNPLTSLAGITNFPNLISLDIYGCQQLTSIEDITSLPQLRRLDISYCQQISIPIINSLTYLTDLTCRGIYGFTPAAISNLTNLHSLSIGDNFLTSLNLSYFPNLTQLYCDDNNLSSLDLSPVPNLTDLVCISNNLTSLDLSSVPNLTYLICYQNHLTSLNLTGLSQLQTLDCSENNITALDFSSSPLITYLICSNNNLTTLDLSNAHNISHFECVYMPNLTTLFIKNGSPYDDWDNGIAIFNCPNLQYICADDRMIPIIQDEISGPSGSPNCHVNSYCSFTPGGTFYTMQGNTHYDSNNNGCDITDINYPNLKLTFASFGHDTTFYANTTGAYHYDVEAGNYSITPTFENTGYFSISPTTVNANFPTDASPFLQNFCITPNGVHNDLEVELIPTNRARPGFDATYSIIYKNNGTASQSGSINLTFDDGVLDLVSANPNFSSQGTNSLSWNFSNLLPFESREILITLNVNTPSESPAVNGGDILYYTATVTGLTDETPIDNTFTLNQTVVNSFDPNDKTCLEGSVITPSMVGEYVHYIIRFENTGTANAQNIVVKDMIDTTKFDINTLTPLRGSHPFTTRITNTNQVEFIFENINLPFDDANNDGYVSFKIKTIPTLTVGSTFSNTANIYFDYNAPIVTNTATTTVSVLGTQDFEFSNLFSLSPVPAKNSLTITTKQDVTISSVNIYNTLGQLVQVNANPNQTIDVSGLKTGSYFIKIISDKGTASSKFIKE